MANRPKIKYMGSAHVARLEKGEDLGGQMAEPLKVELEWNEGNRFVLDFSDDKYSDVPDEFLTALVEVDPDRFKDVTDLQRIPPNENQRIFRAAKGGETAEELQEAQVRAARRAEREAEATQPASVIDASSEAPNATSSATGAGAAATTGGTTGGGGARGARGGGGRGATGGSST